MDVQYLVLQDVDNVLSLSKKYNLNVASWYWRLNETEEEWITRIIKLSIERKEVIGYLLGDTISITYTIPLENTTDEVIIQITENMLSKQVKTPYASLYETLEKYL